MKRWTLTVKEHPDSIDRYLPKAGKFPMRWRLAFSLQPGIVGSLFKLIMSRHSVVTLNHERFINAVSDDKPLITVMNHHSNIDDVGLLGHLLPLSLLFNGVKMRWTFTAYDICFTNAFTRRFFIGGKCCPVWRNVYDEDGTLKQKGHGVYQRPCDYLIENLNAGQWVNIYPQGKVIYGHMKSSEASLRLKWGVGRLIADAAQHPTVLPVWHEGMEDVGPMKRPYAYHILKEFVKGNRKVTINVGAPMNFEDLRLKFRMKQISAEETRRKITDQIQERLYEMREQTLLMNSSRAR